MSRYGAEGSKRLGPRAPGRRVYEVHGVPGFAAASRSQRTWRGRAPSGNVNYTRIHGRFGRASPSSS